jgi:hypothetical protein
MVGQFDIRAAKVAHLPVRYNIGVTFAVSDRESGTESKILVWMPRDTLEMWGFEWIEKGGVDSGAALILVRIGLGRILDMIHTEDAFPTEVAVRSDTLGLKKPRLVKECAFKKERDSSVFCGVAALDDPHGGETSEFLCERCHMPDVTLVCSDMLSPRTAWYPGETEQGVRDLVQSMCRSGNDPGTGASCLPGIKDCWVKSVEIL